MKEIIINDKNSFYYKKKAHVIERIVHPDNLVTLLCHVDIPMNHGVISVVIHEANAIYTGNMR